MRPTFSIDQMCPESWHDKFGERSSISKYDTRYKTDLQIPRLNLDFSRKSFNYTGLRTWNSILTHIRESNTLTLFTNGLKSHFLSRRKHSFTHESMKEQCWHLYLFN